jgi:hypothetical protein
MTEPSGDVQPANGQPAGQRDADASSDRARSDRAGTARSSWDQASSEQAGSEQAGSEPTGREQAGREEGSGERSGRGRSGHELGGHELGGRERGGRELGGRERGERERGERERSSRSGGGRPGAAGSAESWEQRAAGVASEVQRWLIRTSARNMRDELGGQVKKAFRGPERDAGDSWATATTEPPHAADEAPECAWCPVCRAARRIAQARAAGTDSRGGPRISDAADVMAGAVRDALSGIDSILSYRPGAASSSGAEAPGAPARSERSATAESTKPAESAKPAAPAESAEPDVQPSDDTAERG